MAPSRIPAPPHARTLVHPGPCNPMRIVSRHAERARHFRLRLEPGRTLFDAIVRPLAASGVHNASITLLGGVFDRLQYCTAPPDPARLSVIAYTAPIDGGRAWMVFGNATIGQARDGRPLVHCHATMRTQAGTLKGGHVVPQATVVGSAPIAALVTALDGFALRAAFDPETNIDLLQPMDAGGVRPA
jgi:predicted DNA-binding protein with PD1-like motif